jgi:hypothetical protein
MEEDMSLTRIVALRLALMFATSVGVVSFMPDAQVAEPVHNGKGRGR